MSKLREIIDYLEQKRMWLESGTIIHNGNLWSYKFQKLKKKAPKTKEADGQ